MACPSPTKGLGPQSLAEVFICEDCGEEYRGFKFISLHMREEHNKEVDYETARRAKTAYVIYAGKGRTIKPPVTPQKVVKIKDTEDADDVEEEEEEEVEEDMYQEFDCKKCPFIASSQKDLDAHTNKVHVKKQKPRVNCTECERDFKTKYELAVHVKGFHLGLKEHKCPQCDYCSADKSRVKKHLQMVHWKIKTKQCPHCDYESYATSAMKSHIRAIHTKEKLFKCDYCDHTAAQKGQVTAHMKAKHLDMKPFECEECEYRTISNSGLQKHIRIKHLKIRNHLCPHCGYGAMTVHYLERHIAKKHAVKKKKGKVIMLGGFPDDEPEYRAGGFNDMPVI